MKFRCVLCHAIYDEVAPCEDSPAEAKGVCAECAKREGLIPPTGEPNEN